MRHQGCASTIRSKSGVACRMSWTVGARMVGCAPGTAKEAQGARLGVSKKTMEKKGPLHCSDRRLGGSARRPGRSAGEPASGWAEHPQGGAYQTCALPAVKREPK